MDYFYKEIENRPGRLDNLQYYMLERKMQFEMKKVFLKTVTEVEKTDKYIDHTEEIMKISNMARVKNIFLYKKLGKLYIDTYPDYQIYVDAINTLNNIIGKWLGLLETWEIEGHIQSKDILEEISVFPRMLNTTSYRNDYKARKGFNEDKYQTYNSLLSEIKQGQYLQEVRKMKNEINEIIPRLEILKRNEKR